MRQKGMPIDVAMRQSEQKGKVGDADVMGEPKTC
jgi:hypothetical protein